MSLLSKPINGVKDKDVEHLNDIMGYLYIYGVLFPA